MIYIQDMGLKVWNDVLEDYKGMKTTGIKSTSCPPKARQRPKTQRRTIY